MIEQILKREADKLPIAQSTFQDILQRANKSGALATAYIGEDTMISEEIEIE